MAADRDDEDTKRTSVPKRHMSDSALKVSDLNAAQLEEAAKSTDPRVYAAGTNAAISNTIYAIEKAWQERLEKRDAYIAELEAWADESEAAIKSLKAQNEALKIRNGQLRDQIQKIVGR